jgi:hypothetical protein
MYNALGYRFYLLIGYSAFRWRYSKKLGFKLAFLNHKKPALFLGQVFHLFKIDTTIPWGMG